MNRYYMQLLLLFLNLIISANSEDYFYQDPNITATTLDDAKEFFLRAQSLHTNLSNEYERILDKFNCLVGKMNQIESKIYTFEVENRSTMNNEDKEDHEQEQKLVRLQRDLSRIISLKI